MRLLIGLSTEHLKTSILKRTVTPGKYPASNYMFKVNSINTKARCEICSKLTIKTGATPSNRGVYRITAKNC